MNIIRYAFGLDLVVSSPNAASVRVCVLPSSARELRERTERQQQLLPLPLLLMGLDGWIGRGLGPMNRSIDVHIIAVDSMLGFVGWLKSI